MKNIKKLLVTLTLLVSLSTFTFAGGNSGGCNTCGSGNSGSGVSVGNVLDKTGNVVDHTLNKTGSLLDSIKAQLAICLSINVGLCL